MLYNSSNTTTMLMAYRKNIIPRNRSGRDLFLFPRISRNKKLASKVPIIRIYSMYRPLKLL
jgi:hypothetical protein